MKINLLPLLLACSLLAAGLARGAEITVFAAASLTESLKEIAVAFEKQTGDKVGFNFAASGPLVRQIEAGAPADVFFSADEAKMDVLDKKGLIVKTTRQSRLSNQLVIVALPDATVAIASPKDLVAFGVKRIALGDPQTVPAGTYSKEYLAKLELWPEVEKKMVPCESVRAVLMAVESGNVEAGIVYRTDAAISKKVKIVYVVPAEAGPKISYPVALLKDARQPEAAGKFLKYLTTSPAGEVFARRGFLLLSAEVKK